MTRRRVNRPITYELISSNLPEYLRVVQNGNITVAGVVQLHDERTPQWQTPGGNLAELDEEQDNVSIQLEASPGAYNHPVRYMVGPDFNRRGGALPFGLKLDSDTGLISGTVIRNLVNRKDPNPFFDKDRPVWTTENQNWVLTSRDNFELQLEVTPVKGETLNYYVTTGGLPFGLTLNNQTGMLSGELSVVITNEGVEIPEVEPKPRWRTAPGRLAVNNEAEEFTFNLEATPRNGQQVEYFIQDGGLPFGIRLNRLTGELKGDTAEVYYPELPVLIDKNAPVIANNENLGKLKQGSFVNVQMVARTHAGRSIRFFEIYPDKKRNTYIPFGLTFTKQGLLDGFISEDALPGLYQFTVVVHDSVGLRSCKIFHLEVEA